MNIHCPICGQQQVSNQTRFCSRCGFLLTGVLDLVNSGGVLPKEPADDQAMSPRKKGIKQGLFIFLLAFLIVPILAILTVAAHAEPFVVIIASVFLTVGGLLRMAYALMFQSDSRGMLGDAENASKKISASRQAPALSGSDLIPNDIYSAPSAGRWNETGEPLKPPGTVTESTTKLLKKETR